MAEVGGAAGGFGRIGGTTSIAGLGSDHNLKFEDACGGEMGGRGGAIKGFGPPGPVHIGLGGW